MAKLIDVRNKEKLIHLGVLKKNPDGSVRFLTREEKEEQVRYFILMVSGITLQRKDAVTIMESIQPGFFRAREQLEKEIFLANSQG
ncbi:MAG: hypothetical protein KC736_00305 [Candidatus Moranbacteria bacterium]|nr:hypothetical protein [Candidatus Moranbacteria bacterium]